MSAMPPTARPRAASGAKVCGCSEYIPPAVGWRAVTPPAITEGASAPPAIGRMIAAPTPVRPHAVTMPE